MITHPEPSQQRLRQFHLLVGLLGLAAFVLSGQYMHHVLGHLKGLPDAPRLLYRTAHIYLMWAALPNLLLGLHMQSFPATGWRRWLHLAGSALMLAAPAWIASSFLLECGNASLARPWCRIGIETAFAGGLMHAVAQVPVRRRRAAAAA